MNKRYITLAIVIILIVGAIYYLESQRAEVLVQEPVTAEPELKEGLYPRAPELTGISGYLNTGGEEINISQFRGKVVLVDFWTYTCINCIRTFPFLKDWDNKYRDSGLVIIGVHTPEFNFEKEYDNVQAAIDRNEIKYRVVQDNDYSTWAAYKNRFWPRKYLIDAEGYIRYDHIGEGAYAETEEKIQELLAEIGKNVSEIKISEEAEVPLLQITPELYAGYSFALSRFQNLGNDEGFKAEIVVDYTLPTEIGKNQIYLDGAWKNNIDNLEAQEAGKVSLNFTAASVNFVARTITEPIKISVKLNNQPITNEQAGDDVQFSDGEAFIIIDRDDLYNLVRGDYGNYLLTLEIDKAGFTFNTFTFGGGGPSVSERA